MKIAILGAGNVGGHDITLGVRDESSQKVRRAISHHPAIKTTPVSEAVQDVELIILALPINAVVDVARRCGDLSDKFIIDATNTVSQKPAPYAHATQAFKELAKCNDIAKCFNSTGFENMENPNFAGTSADMFVAGDSEKAKNIATQFCQRNRIRRML